MLYLEDFLEMIENLPMEMRDRFTEMREMDLQVENAMDNLDEKVKAFFRKCGTVPNLKQDWKDEQMAKILQEYRKAGEDADEKVQMAKQSYELVERHLRKLDQEVAKFKMELEADNAGITEILERRAMEVEKPIPQVSIHKSEKRKFPSGMRPMVPDRFQPVATEFSRESGGSYGLSTKSNSSAASSPATVMFESAQKPPTNSSVNYNLGQVGSGSNAAIAVAASRAIGATLEMQQGRRSASLKASYEAVSKNFDFTKDISLGRQDLAAATSSKLSTTSNKLQAQAATSSATAEGLAAAPMAKPSSKKKSASRSSASHLNQQLQQHHNQQQQQQLYQQHAQQQQQQQPTVHPTSLPADLLGSLDSLQDVKADGTEASVAVGWQADPNEPRYCICNDISYGDMVACDNADCPVEWFHYGCVGLQLAPRGKWYCPQCQATMKRRKDKK